MVAFEPEKWHMNSAVLKKRISRSGFRQEQPVLTNFPSQNKKYQAIMLRESELRNVSSKQSGSMPSLTLLVD